MASQTYRLSNLPDNGKKHLYWRNGILAFLICMSVMALLGGFSFFAWQQVLDLYNYHVPFDVLFGHPHFFRYLVAYPGLLLSDLYGEQMFSLYIVCFMAMSIYLMYYLLRDAKSSIILFSCTSVFILHIFMNGRGAISWLGWMMILYVIFTNSGQKDKISNTLILLLALLMCSVSSGTFSVAYATIILFYTYKFIKYFRFVNIHVLISLLIPIFISYAYYDLFMSGLDRNLNYYRIGSRNIIYNMLEHGFGSIVLEHPIYISIAIALLVIIFSYLFFSLKTKPTILEFIAIGVPLAGGVFGYTTMTLAIPSFCLVVFARIGGVDLIGRQRSPRMKAIPV